MFMQKYRGCGPRVSGRTCQNPAQKQGCTVLQVPASASSRACFAPVSQNCLRTVGRQ